MNPSDVEVLKLYNLLHAVTDTHGEIVSSNDCNSGEIDIAKACGRFWVDSSTNLGYVMRPPRPKGDDAWNNPWSDFELKLEWMRRRGEAVRLQYSWFSEQWICLWEVEGQQWRGTHKNNMRRAVDAAIEAAGVIGACTRGVSELRKGYTMAAKATGQLEAEKL